MSRVLDDCLLFSCLAAFVTGIATSGLSRTSSLVYAMMRS